ncbi:MAG: cyclodeaminase/cyclohydrolase family protein [Phycisphaerae bacterium]
MSSQEQTDIFSRPVSSFLDELAAKQPTPGGGSVAALAAALAAGLGQMSLAYSQGKKNLATHAEAHEKLAGKLEAIQKMARRLLTEDMEAFNLYQRAQSMDEGPEKLQASRMALAAAINVPRELAKLSLAMLDELYRMTDKVTPWLVSDLKAAAAMAVAAVRLSEYNVQINAAQLDDTLAAGDLVAAAAADTRRADTVLGAIEHAGGDR